MLPELYALHHISDFIKFSQSQLAGLWEKIERGVHTGVADINNTVDFDVNDIDGSAPDAAADTTSSFETLKEKSEIRNNKNLSPAAVYRFLDTKPTSAPVTKAPNNIDIPNVSIKQNEFHLTNPRADSKEALNITLKQKELNRFHHTMRIVKIMFRYSFIHKAIIIPIALASTLILPESFMQLLSPVFAILGIHIGVKASRNLQELAHKVLYSKKSQKLIHKVLNSDKLTKAFNVVSSGLATLGIDLNISNRLQKFIDKISSAPIKTDHKHKLSQIVEKNRKADLATTAEITGALMELMRTLPIPVRITIMAIYGVCMPVVLRVVTGGLLMLEHYGYGLKAKGDRQSLEQWSQQLAADSDPIRPVPPTLPNNKQRMGRICIAIPHTVFGAIVPCATVVAQFYTSGRTITHAFRPAATLAHSYISPDNFLAWSGASIVATVGVRAAFGIANASVTKRIAATAVAPANRLIEGNRSLKAWKSSAEEVVKRTRKVIEKEKQPDSTLSVFGKNLRRAVYTPYLLTVARSRLSKIAA